MKFLSLALLMSGGSFVVVQKSMTGAVRKASAEAAAKAQPQAQPTVQVLVAAEPLAAGSILKAGQVRWQAWPANAPTNGYLTQANARLEQMTGAVVRANLEPGEPLTAARVVQPGQRGVMAAVLQPGYRAVTVNITAATGVAGFVVPGDRVDLILSRDLGARQFVSETVLQDVRVLAMDQRDADAKKGALVAQTATLEVSPKGAEIIAVTGQLGTLSLALRSLAEPGTPVPLVRTVTHTSAADATGGASPRPGPSAAAAAARPRVARSSSAIVQVFRGGQAAPMTAAFPTGGAQ
ncbi:Flp pilus assembly protein CpaB [Phenylobacterium soli]|uniref:Flp pilus assembly protein CpaB n=1 Tax=Phenylobacterium soli TaxID=2170551 RepID=A0A328AEM0_9CAUL|nr:Flp pilus assembly protein CpaB [Phenylobacterium soli]RAK51824.1 Flp pilus assembly protein CpaB [Phenylobacterium soli]